MFANLLGALSVAALRTRAHFRLALLETRKISDRTRLYRDGRLHKRFFLTRGTRRAKSLRCFSDSARGRRPTFLASRPLEA